MLATHSPSFFALVLITLLTSTVAFGQSEDRFSQFTDREGRTIQAEIIRASLEEVWLRRDDDRTFRIPIDRFSENDQKRIAEWLILTDLQRLGLEITARRFRTERRALRQGNEVSYRQEARYEITIKNNLRSDLENLRAEYRVFKRHAGYDSSPQNRQLSHIEGSQQIEKISARSDITLSTENVELNLDRGDRWTGVSYQMLYPDDLAGVWVRIFLGDHQIGELASPGDLMTRESW